MSKTRMLAALTAAAAISTSALCLAPSPAQAVTLPSVTNGWSAVIVGTTGTANGTLMMVSPAGRQYRIATVGYTWGIEDVSNYGRRVLLINALGNDPVVHTLVDTRTGKMQRVGGSWSDVRFTQNGAGLLAHARPGRAGVPLYRTDLNGRAIVGFPGTGDGYSVLPSSDGTKVVVSTRKGLQVHSAVTGKVLRKVVLPMGTGYCITDHNLTNGRFTVSCMPGAMNLHMQVYSASTTGGAPIRLTSAITKTTYTQFGFLDSWGTPKGQYVEVGVGCGPAPLAKVTGKTVKQVSRRGDSIMGLVGSTAFYKSGASDCSKPATQVVKHDLATGKFYRLAGGTKNPGLIVRSAELVDSTR